MDIDNLEAEIKSVDADKGPIVTSSLIDAAIKDEYYHIVPGTTMTLCVLALQNGFLVTGESAATSLENFNEEIGRKVAKENAKQKIWALEGYLLKDRLYNA